MSDNEFSVFGETWENRSKINSKTITKTTSFSNSNSYPLELELITPNASNVTHKWDVAIKKNMAGVLKKTEWRANFLADQTYPFPNPTLTGWENIDGLIYSTTDFELDGKPKPNAIVSTLKRPDDVIHTSAVEIKADLPNLPASTAWFSKAKYCEPTSSTSYQNLYKVGNHGQRMACANYAHSSNPSYSGHHFGFEERIVYVANISDGYPKVDQSKSESTLPVLTIVTVTIDGNIRQPANGKYQIPSGSNVDIKLEFKLPIISIFNDASVGNSYNSYELGKLDTEFKWVIDSNLTLNLSDDSILSQIYLIGSTTTNVLVNN